MHAQEHVHVVYNVVSKAYVMLALIQPLSLPPLSLSISSSSAMTLSQLC